jgi:putative intracellular protease/amidase
MNSNRPFTERIQQTNRRQLTVLGVVGIAIVAFGGIGANCTPQQGAKTVLSFTQALCIVANAESDDKTVAAVCGVEQALYPALRDLLGTTRAANQKAAQKALQGVSQAPRCPEPTDAGAGKDGAR